MNEEQQDKAREYALRYLVEQITSLADLLQGDLVKGYDRKVLEKRMNRLQADYTELAWVFDEVEERELVHS